jgi:hypothetical protein
MNRLAAERRKRKRPLTRRATAIAAMQLMLGGSALTSDAIDLDTRDAKIGQLAIREQRQLTHGLTIPEIGLHLSEDIRNEHWELLNLPAVRRRPAFLPCNAQISLCDAQKKGEFCKGAMP